ncbi:MULTISPECIES: 2-phospho-L-lactate guanylyltransferase [unclassified Solwaraspora]|uniref:2-phospho-L-lactate guanylyltransferase n=1 Tax=unclassified Solwaraspora TaxID=2627926 RepID=UPI00248C3FAA|nr:MULTISPECIES: 2-phospho-L-lactate guanylyltransferase [unclassified Solwaraspora]WBB98464.1 2-phospho-L-lactate guanylyltransferase [Solwaraspora sp. WMMA2059]WBC22983.1 2-phospho-L-lactate guanylyltransferase [Solwaraspora sp. WMMA2080]WJK34983.1 2-phospho-L-lactate guanylyltransferase [Solwaraspora sp. WMMA2065]
MRNATWSVVLPVKRLAVAKSRLRGALDGVPHEELALALARDTVAAALACPLVAEVVVVTSDPAATAALGALGARTVADPELAAPDLAAPDLGAPEVSGLNAAVAHGAATVGGSRPVAALTADLPALRPAELAAALDTDTASAVDTAGTRARRWFVPDAAGTGTVLLAAAVGTALRPGFGAGSAVRHQRSGAVRRGGDWPTLRRDVDTAADLADAARLGLGRHTAALYASGYRADMRQRSVS